jgi:hypothetical protein
MTDKQKRPKRRKQKPGPKEERLIIKGDPERVIDALLKKEQPKKDK